MQTLWVTTTKNTHKNYNIGNSVIVCLSICLVRSKQNEKVKLLNILYVKLKLFDLDGCRKKSIIILLLYLELWTTWKIFIALKLMIRC